MIKFLSIVLSAIALVYDQKKHLVKVLALPFLLFLLIDASEYEVENAALIWLFTILELFVYVVFAIVIHRTILLGRDSVGAWGFLGWTKRETYFLLNIIGMFIISSVILGVASNMQFPGTMIGLIGVVYVWGRVSLVFPGVAIDHEMTMISSWRLTRNHQVLICLIVGLVPVLFFVPTLGGVNN